MVLGTLSCSIRIYSAWSALKGHGRDLLTHASTRLTARGETWRLVAD
jgi:hypothetical protein